MLCLCLMPLSGLHLRLFSLSSLQLSTLAEFRGDWAGAVRLYREAYGYVPQVLRLIQPFGWLVSSALGGFPSCCSWLADPAAIARRGLSSPQVLAGSMGQPQRFAEVRTVAEYVHVKVRCTWCRVIMGHCRRVWLAVSALAVMSAPGAAAAVCLLLSSV